MYELIKRVSYHYGREYKYLKYVISTNKILNHKFTQTKEMNVRYVKDVEDEKNDLIELAWVGLLELWSNDLIMMYMIDLFE